MKKVITICMILIARLGYGFAENEMVLIADDLHVSVEKVKSVIPFWKQLKNKKVLLSIYRQKILKKNNRFNIQSIYTLLQSYPEIEYIKIFDKQVFAYEPFPISKFPKSQVYNGEWGETFIVKIPNGKVCKNNGIVFVGSCDVVLECLPDDPLDVLEQYVSKESFKDFHKVSGAVAVVSCYWSKCYFHWITEVVARILMLQEKDIPYDWIYISDSKPFMKETLELLGVDTKKILRPEGKYSNIQADMLIVPSYPANKNIDPKDKIERLGVFVADWVVEKLRTIVLSKDMSGNNFSKKVFISRKDKNFGRRMDNEDEIFSFLQSKGYERYCLSELSFLDQASLFYNAESVIGAHGAGLTNIIFCKPGTQVIEIFQARSDCTYFYMAQQLHLKYDYIQTQEFDEFYGYKDTAISLDLIKNLSII